MKTSDRWPDSLAQQISLVFIISAVSLYIIGTLAIALGKMLIGQVPLTPQQLAQFVYPSLLSPKPLDRLVFLAVVFSVVPVLALATVMVRRFSFQVIPPNLIHRSKSGAKLPASDLPNSVRDSRLVEWLITASVMIFAIYAGGYYRWFGADEVDYKFTAPESLDAVIFSITRISQGGTCLADVVAQYGCYGEFFRPLWTFVTPSVKAVTTVFFLLYLVAVFATTRFSVRIIRRPEMLLFCGIALVALNSFYAFFDVDLQYWPLRTLFPCLGLWLAGKWQEGPNVIKAAGMGFFSALAISWNLDSGIPVLLSLAILIALTGCTQAESLRAFFSRERFLHLSIYSLGAALTLALAFAYLSLKAGAFIDPGLYIHYQRIFYIAGFLMLPIPSLPHPWGLVVAAILLALAASAVRVLRGRLDERSELLGFAAILAIGVFVYYTGRSHIRVLETVSWLPSILAFCLADRMIEDNTSNTMKNILHLACAGCATVFVIAWIWFYGKGIDDRWAAQLHQFTYAKPLREDAAFIARETKPDESIAVFAPSQGSLVLTAGRKLDLSGPGITETILWSDANKTMNNLLTRGPEHLFLDPRIRSSELYFSVYSVFEDRIRATYVAQDWEPNGRLLHMVRRRTEMDRDAVPYDRPLQVSGDRNDFPLSVAKSLPGSSFDLEMTIIADARQERLAILASTSEMEVEPFQGIVVYHQMQMGQDHWVLAMGNGSGWTRTQPFLLPSGRPVKLRIFYAAPKLEITADDKVIFGADHFSLYAPTKNTLEIGDWIPHMFHAATPTDSPVDAKYVSPNYWKIQDRRFNGEVISARLLP
jgi:hypothetical protein